jgi:hypothetical protein
MEAWLGKMEVNQEKLVAKTEADQVKIEAIVEHYKGPHV